jgi:hypothetical protein
MASHECPARGCTQRVALHMLMCRPHWYMVPRALRGAVWAAWDGGYGARTPEHAAAMRDAIRAVNERLEEVPRA